MAQHHPQLLGQLQKWVVSFCLHQWLPVGGARRHYRSQNLTRIISMIVKSLSSILSDCGCVTNQIDFKVQVVNHDWGDHLWSENSLARSDCDSEWRPSVRRNTGFPQPQSPRSWWEPSELSKRSGRYHNQLLVMNTSHQRCIQANEKAVFVPHRPIRAQEFGNSFLMACDRWRVASESRMWIPRLQSSPVRTLYSN